MAKSKRKVKKVLGSRSGKNKKYAPKIDWRGLGSDVKMSREDADLSQQAFGDSCGISRLTVIRLESGFAVSAESLLAVSNVSDIFLSDYFTPKR